ncbi:MAG: TIGR04219 family outer membrane beta-barrel protein [Gammaproteobacteria bacterium]|nr:TIGR04219 family outer membrane beta-barrel protein [Gammaproteobacteria bacterium]
MTTRFLKIAGISGSLLMAAGVQAETLFGVYAGAGTWQQEFSGDVASGGEEVDLERDLDFDRERNNVLYAGLEHGVPVLPNVRVNHARVAGEGRSVLTRTVEFRGETFSISEDVASEVELTQSDAVLYYELLDNVVSLDLGIAARWIDGEIEVASESAVARAEFEGVLPLLYARGRVDLPLTGLWAGAEAQGLAYDGHSLIDASAQIGWTSPVGLGAELGWRTLRLDLDDIDDIDHAEIDISGPYAAVNFYF